MRCHQVAFAFEFESKKVCRACTKLLAGKRAATGKFLYTGNTRDQHKRKVLQASTRLTGVTKGRHKLRRARSEPSSPDISGGIFEPAMELEEPTVVDDTAPFIPPSILRMQCMTLFIPFDAGNNFYRNNAKQGTFEADFVPQGNNVFAPRSNLAAAQALSAFNTKPYPSHQPFEAQSTPMEEAEILAGYNNIVLKHIMACTNTVEWKRLHASKPIDVHAQLSRLVPEVIFLSEELKGAPFPSVLQPCAELKYRKIGGIRQLLDPQVDAKNEIAAYVLMDENFMTQVVYNARTLVRKGVKHDEKWLCVQKILPEFKVCFEVAGVHLDAGYTGFSSAPKKKEALEEVGQFAVDNEVDALLGDLNMDSFELNGGFFPSRFSFQLHADNTVKPVYTLSHSNTNAKNNYMGGLIANTDQVETEAMNLRGEDTVSLSRTLDGRFYSDHPAIMANYFKSFPG
ncbi:hypothetical protein ACN469_10610 [Corallococcus terminator]